MKLTTIIICLASSVKLYGQYPDYIPFIWSNDTLNGTYFEKTAMHIPVRLCGDTHTYYFQFDTGANKSFRYTKDLSDSLLPQNCIVGDSTLSDIGVLHLIPISSNRVYQKNGKTFIGTIGADFLKDKIVEINFVDQKIELLEFYDTSNYELLHCKGSNGRPTLTLAIDHQQMHFLFDTGSSLFDLWTTKKLWDKWRDPNGEVQEYPIRSWGKINIASRATFLTPYSIGKKNEVELNEIWFNSNRKFKKSFQHARLSGIIGNKPFIYQTLLIDMKNHLFGIKHTAIKR